MPYNISELTAWGQQAVVPIQFIVCGNAAGLMLSGVIFYRQYKLMIPNGSYPKLNQSNM